MCLQDDDALAVDRAVIDNPIEGAAPEAAGNWRDFCQQYALTVHVVEDRRGLTIRSRKTRIEFDQKSMHWLWLLGFAGWKAWRLHGPHLFWKWFTTQQIDRNLRSLDPSYSEAEADYELLRYVMRDIRSLASADEITWPDNLPQPQVDASGFDLEDRAAFELLTIALAYIFLHEARHVQFYVEKNRPAPIDEELACDTFARNFIMDGAARYAGDVGLTPDRVIAKRSAGIALGTFALYDLTQSDSRGGSSTYPPIADRLTLIYETVALPIDNWFWDFAASLLIALIVREDQTFTIPNLVGRDLALALIDVLRRKNQNSVE